jgi:apolipoprotein D and lipocalin family protein
MRIARQPLFLRGSCLILIGLSLVGCGGHSLAPPPVQTAPSVDLSRYVGLWYEIARLPMWAQDKCVASTAEYRLLETGEVGVRNACVTRSGDETSIEGTATVVDHKSHAKLNVVFDKWVVKVASWFTPSKEGNYWILRLDPDYRWAMVGTPDRRYLWILGRTPVMEEPLYQDLVDSARQLGFPMEQLIRSKQ